MIFHSKSSHQLFIIKYYYYKIFLVKYANESPKNKSWILFRVLKWTTSHWILKYLCIKWQEVKAESFWMLIMQNNTYAFSPILIGWWQFWNGHQNTIIITSSLNAIYVIFSLFKLSWVKLECEFEMNAIDMEHATTLYSIIINNEKQFLVY